jgi:hypothetical protein
LLGGGEAAVYPQLTATTQGQETVYRQYNGRELWRIRALNANEWQIHTAAGDHWQIKIIEE